MNGDSSRASDASPVEVTKKSIRLNIWKQVRKNQSGRVPYFAYNRIPWFTGNDDPVIKLKELDVFKNAQSVLVGFDKAQESIKLACLREKKTLYVQVPRLQKSLMTCLQLDDDATEEVMLQALKLKGLEQYGKPIGLEDQITLDLVVIGSIAVSKDGIRIGRGGGYVDLYLAILSHLKMITPNTVIITTVHDCQILDSIPPNIVGAYDFPVDVIVTPTQEIQCSHEKSASIMWNLIMPRQLKTNQLIAKIRDNEISAGNDCTLRSIESDIENGVEKHTTRRFYHRNRWGNNRRWQGQRYRRHQANGVQSESEQYEGGEGESGNANDKPERQRRPYVYRRKKMQNKDGKSTYRDKAWDQLRVNRVTTTPRYPYFRIPGFRGANEATQHLRDLDVYKNSENILVGIDKLYEPIRLACLEDGKKLFVLNPKPEKELIIRVEVPQREEKVELKNLVNKLGLEENGEKIEPESCPKIDLWVIGSVAISKDGYHIGKGNGLIDLCFGFLSEKNIINLETTILTVVHNYQVFDTLPAELFGDHDIPVDVIVTPSEVIEIKSERKPSPGILWNLVSEHLLSRLPYLSEFRKKEIEAGKPCTLKENNVDKKAQISNDQSESEHNELTEGESGDQGRKRRTGPKHIRRFQRRNKDNGENEESGNISPDTTSARPSKKRYVYRRTRLPHDFSIKLTSINRSTRVRDLKAALNERNVKPNMITWLGSRGYCYLHFSKTVIPWNPEPEPELTSDSILSALADLTIHPTADEEANSATPQPNKVSVELAKPYTRIETANETAV